jgi:hypothetical protein
MSANHPELPAGLRFMKVWRWVLVAILTCNVGIGTLNVIAGSPAAFLSLVMVAALAATIAWQTKTIRQRVEQLRPRPDYSRIASMEREVWGEKFEHAGAPAPLPRVVATRRTYACTKCGRAAHTSRRLCAGCYKKMNWG